MEGRASQPGEEAPRSARVAQRVLVVDDEAPMRRAMARVLAAAGFEVDEADDGADAARRASAGEYDVVVSDIMMPKMSGVELLRAIRQADLELPVVLVTGAPALESATKAIELGAYQYLTKPFDFAQLVQVVTRAVSLHRLALAKREAMNVLGSTLARAGDPAGLDVSLSSALGSLWMACQPILRAADRSLHAHEALLRSEERALPHPGAVLDAAERLGRLPELGRRVREAAAAAAGLDTARGDLFVNLHSRDLVDDSLLDPSAPLSRVASRVVLEVTERATLDDVPNVRERIAALRALGYRIAVDDLGAGYAGLTTFAALEPDVVKLDMSLVRDIDRSSTKQKVVRSMTKLSHEMGALVVAEGIETPAERDVTIALGCDLLQGYLFAKPGRPFPEFRWGPEAT
ncbi:MAG: EAL domain-containing response regulator [Polyangiaceae bacterium]|nr:EAL domain-containing response regulator [Polyangiaceae bacterium]